MLSLERMDCLVISTQRGDISMYIFRHIDLSVLVVGSVGVTVPSYVYFRMKESK